MKMKVILCASMFSMFGCQPKDQNLADPTLVQEQAAQVAYDDLRARDFDGFLKHVDPELQMYFHENPKLLKKFAQSIPQDQMKSKTLMRKSMEQDKNKQTQYKVSYEIAYPDNLVQYDVSFDQPNGSAQIRNINIQVFGK